MQQIKSLILRPSEVRDLLAGRAVVRREMKPQPPEEDFEGPYWYPPTCIDKNGETYPGKEVYGLSAWDGEWGIVAPYHPGQVAYIREAWKVDASNHEGDTFVYKADGGIEKYPNNLLLWLSPATMPRAACRLWGTVESVRPERTDAGWEWVYEVARAERPEGWE
jgi:hypothetical protein